MINVYTVNDTDYESNGAAVLTPTSAVVKEEAAAQYELTLSHPLDPRGVWKFLTVGNIIKVPVPVAHIDSALVGEDVDVWKVDRDAPLYVSPKAPQKITYQGWYVDLADDVGLTIGMKVTAVASTSGGGKFTTKNYQLTAMPHGNDVYKSPRDLPAYWKEIPSETPGAAVITTLKADTEVFLISEYNDSWLYVQTVKGYQGYIQKAFCSFVRTEQISEAPERDISTQLFRIYNTQIDTAKKTITVSARHVSYDLAGNMISECVLTNASAQTAIARMHGALFFESDNTIASNIPTALEDYSATLTYKNPVSALLDPDIGIVPHFGGKLIRDNWDFFVFENKTVDRGLRLEYGKNLVGVTWKQNTDKLVNRIIPAAQKANGSELLLPEVWVDSPIFDSYPVTKTEYMKIDGKVGGDDGHEGTWTEETLLEHMREIVLKRFDDGCDKAEVEIKVNFVLLGDTVEYAQYKGLQKLFMYDTVTVKDPNVDLDMQLQMIAYEWDAVNLRYNAITLGTVFSQVRRTVSSYNIANGAIQFNKLSQDAINKIRQEVS